MDFITIFLISVGLCFDTFAVSISIGLMKKKIRFFPATRIAFSFAFFQALMPLLGWAIGIRVKEFVSEIDHWLAFILLALIGGKMIYESLKKDHEKKNFDPLNLWALIGMSVATSIDAFIIGISFGFINVNIIFPIIVIGCVTFFVAMLGILFGKKTGGVFGKKMEIIGGLILFGIGLKILIEHLYF
ncbi:MAG: manganese efflux pump [Bacteroidia bacterium]|nr:manganese efflux pump [Bacteroidia bacterium]